MTNDQVLILHCSYINDISFLHSIRMFLKYRYWFATQYYTVPIIEILVCCTVLQILVCCTVHYSYNKDIGLLDSITMFLYYRYLFAAPYHTEANTDILFAASYYADIVILTLICCKISQCSFNTVRLKIASSLCTMICIYVKKKKNLQRNASKVPTNVVSCIVIICKTGNT